MSFFNPVRLLQAAIMCTCISTASSGVGVAGDGVVELLHMWRTKSELRALAVYREALEEQGIKWYDEAVQGNVVMVQLKMSNRIAHGIPPGVVQWVVGDSLQKLVAEGVFKSVPIHNDDLIKQLEPDVLPLITYGDQLASIPVGIHVQNYAVYNKEILDHYGLRQPSSWEELLSYGPILAKDDISLIIWGSQQWQVRQLLTAIFSSVLTPDQFDRLQNSDENIPDLRDQLIRSYEIYLGLLKYNGLRDQTGEWEDTSHLVMQGEALGQFLGDFLVPEMEPLGEIVCALPPESTYLVWGMDSFAFLNVNDKALNDGQEAFVDVAFDIPTNISYVRAKGGIPILLGVDPSLLGKCHAESLRRWQDASPRVFSGGDSWRKRLGLIAEYTAALEDPESQSAEEITDNLMGMLVKF